MKSICRATLVPTRDSGMAMWRERLFSVMLHNVGNVAAYLKLPANRVIELGARVEIWGLPKNARKVLTPGETESNISLCF